MQEPVKKEQASNPAHSSEWFAGAGWLAAAVGTKPIHTYGFIGGGACAAVQMKELFGTSIQEQKKTKNGLEPSSIRSNASQEKFGS